MKIHYVNLVDQGREERNELMPIIDNVLSTGKYIGANAIDHFEETIADLCEVKYAVALNSGTDALLLPFIWLV